LKNIARLGAVAGALVITLTGIAPAHADRYTATDAASDVYKDTCTYDPDTGDETGCTDAVDPTVTEGDILSTLINHGHKYVVITTKFAELTKSTDTRFFYVPLQTNEGYRRDAVLFIDPDFAPYGIFQVTLRNGDDAHCVGADKAIDYTANTITIRVPRTCLSMPYWIRAGAGYGRMTWSETEDTTFLDDAQSNGEILDDVVMSPKVKRAVA